MSHCCSQCSFMAQFESALIMHKQLHHECAAGEQPVLDKLECTAKSLPLVQTDENTYSASCEKKNLKLPSRTSSATRLFDKLRTRICRSKSLFVHPEEGANNYELSPRSQCSSKMLKMESTILDRNTGGNMSEPRKELYACHLCSFDADRITALDRHLLNNHKIGLENLLKLVMAKTKDGLNDDSPIISEYGIRQPYYKQPDDIIEDGEFIIETVTPKVKVLKHAAVNTDLKWTDIPDIKNNCRMVKKELEKLESLGDGNEKDQLFIKMHSLNECMCKFVDSSNTLKKVLTKGYDSKSSSIKNEHSSGAVFDLGLGE